MTDYPEDENGDVLRRMRASGDDLTRPRGIEFVHVMPSEDAARQMASASTELGFTSSVHCDEDGDEWETVCEIEMVPTHQGITDSETVLAELASRFGGRADGWGCSQVE